jgi:hypothetical protein
MAEEIKEPVTIDGKRRLLARRLRALSESAHLHTLSQLALSIDDIAAQARRLASGGR